VTFEAGVFGGDDRLAQPRRHVVITDDHAPFRGEGADFASVASEQAGDGVRAVLV